MKPQIDYRLILAAIGGLIFNLLFWNETIGCNFAIFSVLVMIATFTDREIPYHKNQLITAIGHLAIAFYLIYNNSVLAIITWFITMLVYLGNTHFELLKSKGTALLLGMLQVISGPYGIIKKLPGTKLGKVDIKPIIRPAKYIVLPFVILAVFCFLYSIANPIFAKYTNAIAHSIRDFFTNIFSFFFIDISVEKLLFILFGCCVSGGVIIGLRSKILAEAELAQTDELTRKRRDLKKPSFGYEFRTLLAGSLIKRKMALKTENIIGIISFAGLNVLLFLLNGIDIATLWFNKAIETGKNYSAELHDGTYTLIFSIVIAMLIIVFFFSGNLNFYRKNKWIKLLAYIWMAQNVFLVASVFHRDYDYIFNHGLTYKRIGVLVFATLSLIGLITVNIKVAKHKTTFYLYRVNSKIWYVLLILLSFVNWDVWMVNYNIKQMDKIGVDTAHLMSFSDKTLPLLKKNREKITKHITYQSGYEVEGANAAVAIPNTTAVADSLAAVKPLSDLERKALTTKTAQDNFNRHLDNRINWLLKKQPIGSWLSFSYLEWETAKILKQEP
ncbi:DUF4153 domain-containing protein [Pedobacter nanyangensis]|uniref:DUF4153 domain-containing protein n=1 Tax=Pedobacter nanyangensis TaxID=1562389 RepID=UPI000DE36817|nr:DUF4173 domain-containing protein [Pedobacter nanyangensis]